MDCFDRVDLVSEYDNFDFGFDFDRRCRKPKSLLIVVAVKDERLVDFFLADRLRSLANFFEPLQIFCGQTGRF